MKLTKDEARILGEVLSDGKYDLVEVGVNDGVYEALTDLEERLMEAGKDRRRYGRTSMNDFSDCLKRLVQTHKHSHK